MKPDPAAVGLSVVVLHYNRPWCLELALAALRRALERSGMPFEIIIADDGSDERLHPFLERLAVDQLYIQPSQTSDGTGSTVYDTILSASRMARLPYLLFLEDDFWFLPQGFIDQGKDHQAGLMAMPEWHAELNPLCGAVRLLEEKTDVHFVELARSYANPRYPSLMDTECIYGGVRFRAKQRVQNLPWYTCAWPHVMRTAEVQAIPTPIGQPVWDAEIEMVRARERAFGPHTWVYDPERCFFAHVNIFSWRAIYRAREEPPPEYMPWYDQAIPAAPYLFRHIPAFNHRLLDAFLDGRLPVNQEAFYSSSFIEYTYYHIYRRVAP